MSVSDPTRLIGAVQQMQLLPAMDGLHFSALGRREQMDGFMERGRTVVVVVVVGGALSD